MLILDDLSDAFEFLLMQSSRNKQCEATSLSAHHQHLALQVLSHMVIHLTFPYLTRQQLHPTQSNVDKVDLEQSLIGLCVGFCVVNVVGVVRCPSRI